MKNPSIRIIGELINNAYARARRAWEARDVTGYQQLAQLQADAGAEIVNLNVDGTQRI
jgi:5-methyltetrahydrofolate corrinoid/iron sulfur protein methyltransferase